LIAELGSHFKLEAVLDGIDSIALLEPNRPVDGNLSGVSAVRRLRYGSERGEDKIRGRSAREVFATGAGRQPSCV
jgi:hypothetical protein